VIIQATSTGVVKKKSRGPTQGFVTLFGFSLLLVAVACGPTQQAAPSTGDGGQPKSGGVLTHHETAQIEEHDLTMAQQSAIRIIAPRPYDSLLDVKSGPDLGWNELVITPKLAERWEVSPDSKKYTFYLRKGVKFANLPPVNGRELTAADVKWSLEYIARIGQFKDVKFPLGNQMLPRVNLLEKVDTPDPYTAVVHFKEPYAPFLYFAAESKVAIFPHEVYDQDGSMSERPIGSGPWQLDKEASQTGTRMVYKKNPDYWQTGKPYLDAVRTVIIKEDNASFAAFQTKQLDILEPVNKLDMAEQLKKAVPDARYVSGLGNHGARMWYNMQVAPFTDVRFRRAMSLATDREEFVRTFTKGQGQWGVDGGIPGLFTPEELKKIYPYDPEEAKRLLRESGYTNNPISIEMHYAAATEQITSDVQLLQAQWRKVGIDMYLNPDERVNVSRRQRVGDFMMQTTGTGPGEFEPDFYMYSYFHSQSPNNNYNLVGAGKDAKLDQMTDASRREADPAKRREGLRELARYIDDQGFSLWVYYAPIYFFSQPYVKNFHPSSANIAKPTVDIWLDK